MHFYFILTTFYYQVFDKRRCILCASIREKVIGGGIGREEMLR